MKPDCFDQARVEELWKELSSPVRGYLRKQTGSDADADDLLQEVFLRIHRNVCHLRDTSKLQGWVYRIAHNVVISHVRSPRNRVSAELDAETIPDDSEPSGRDVIDLTPTLRRFMKQLPEIYREPLVRQEFQGQSLQEIAQDLGLTLTATKSRVSRGRGMLREMLDRCCRFEFDRRGRVIEAIPRDACGCARKTGT
jgi:RNA polymerase sigma-70 factor (ECF subfamily)